jgi:hypothetical protein
MKLIMPQSTAAAPPAAQGPRAKVRVGPARHAPDPAELRAVLAAALAGDTS